MLIWISLALVGVVLFALTLVGKLTALPWRLSGFALTIVSLMVSASYLPVNTAFVSWLVLMVFVIAALPWAGWLLGQDERQTKANKMLVV